MELNASQDPVELFKEWLATASKSESNDPEAMALATVDADGQPSVRMVLLKEVNALGFYFYTNMESRKGAALAANPKAALCFHWKSQLRQVRVEGAVHVAPTQMSDDYFNSRHPVSRLGAWASRQSQPLESRAALVEKVDEFRRKFPDDNAIPRPKHWGGYCLIPHKIEFWQQGDARLHDRFLFTRTAKGWDFTRLSP